MSDLVQTLRAMVYPCCEEAADEIERLRAAMQWRPISEAPETGARVTLYVPLYGSGSGHWDNGWHAHFCLNKEAQPTHWMPLPPPPKGAEE